MDCIGKYRNALGILNFPPASRLQLQYRDSVTEMSYQTRVRGLFRVDNTWDNSGVLQSTAGTYHFCKKSIRNKLQAQKLL